MTDTALSALLVSLARSHETVGVLSVFFAQWWPWAALALLVLWVLLGRKDLLVSLWALAAAGVSWLAGVSLVRLFYERVRPFVSGGFEPLIPHAATASFPSAHAAFFTALGAYFLLAGRRKVGWFFLASALVVGVARVVSGLHWPTDVLAGWLAGIAVAWVVWYVRGKAEG